MEIVKKFVQSLGFALVITLSSFFKVSYVIGSYMAMFSISSFITPLSGAFGGVLGGTAVLLIRFLMRVIMFKTLSLSFLAFCIPGYCASLYWATRSGLVRVGIPLGCMILFAAHPIGSQVFVYSLYWLIPIGLFSFGRKTLFLEALGSTFVAHAVGSVIWLYTVPTTVGMWMGLIPIVAVERLCFAVGMVIVYHGIVWMKNMVSSFDTPYYALSSVGHSGRADK